MIAYSARTQNTWRMHITTQVSTAVRPSDFGACSVTELKMLTNTRKRVTKRAIRPRKKNQINIILFALSYWLPEIQIYQSMIFNLVLLILCISYNMSSAGNKPYICYYYNNIQFVWSKKYRKDVLCWKCKMHVINHVFCIYFPLYVIRYFSCRSSIMRSIIRCN